MEEERKLSIEDKQEILGKIVYKWALPDPLRTRGLTDEEEQIEITRWAREIVGDTDGIAGVLSGSYIDVSTSLQLHDRANNFRYFLGYLVERPTLIGKLVRSVTAINRNRHPGENFHWQTIDEIDDLHDNWAAGSEELPDLDDY